MNLSIIIVNWNTADLLTQCLASIYTFPPHCNFEVLVVDNASTDSSVQMVEDQFPEVNLITNQDNVGFARANNQAIRQSHGQYVLLLNSDTEVKPGALQTLIRFIEEQPDVGAVGPWTLNPDGTLQSSCYPAPTLSRELWRLFHLDAIRAYGVYRMANWDRTTPRAVDVLLGACLLIRREVLDQVGLLDEDYFIYSEEVDFCHRVRQAGWQLYWVPQAQIIHYGGQSTRQVAAAMFLQLYRGKLLYFRKHYGWSAALLYKFILLTASLVRLSLVPLAWLGPSSGRQHRLTLASHYWDLVRTLPGM